ncbi:GLE1-like protein-domain-containing protein [Cubamyces lactineus]|nr:GLE1-like protein-domain-containing protein [Cubamyces lactineus]
MSYNCTRTSQHVEKYGCNFTTALEDWTRARDTLKAIKDGPMKVVKGDGTLRSMWNIGRRGFTLRLGQLTNDTQAVLKISLQIMEGIRPPQPHPEPLYIALLSSLAKAVLLQAETEVSAAKRSAIPLAQVVVNLLGSLDGFTDVFWAKLCQRAGGWPIPIIIPATDIDGTPFSDDARRKALGYLGHNEGLVDYTARVSGIMRLYFQILMTPVVDGPAMVVRLPTYWIFLSRMLKEPQLLDSSVAPQILYAALDVGGILAQEVWGQQWVRLLALIYEGITVGHHGQQGRLIGGQSPEGNAARVRVQLEIQRIVENLDVSHG